MKRNRGTSWILCVGIILGILVIAFAIAICTVYSQNLRGSSQTVESVTAESVTAKEEAQQTESAEKEKEYSYGDAVPKSKAVKESYFKDAIFIGNSRTQGFFMYTGLKGAKMYACQGLMVDTFFTDDDYVLNGKRVSMLEAIKANPKFNKAYIMLGMNELGWVYSDEYIKKYKKIINSLRKINPDVTIYVQSILPVSREKSDSSKIYNIKKIRKYNKKLKRMCADKEVNYVNVYAAVANKNGYLPKKAAFDGVHLKADYCKKWLEYLKCHTVEEKQ